MKGENPNTDKPKTVRILVSDQSRDRASAQRRSRKWVGLPWAAAMLAIALLTGGSWFAARLIVNPGSWLRGFLPEWNQGTAGLQTLAEIRAAVAKAGQTVGQPIALAQGDLLLPILVPQPHCRQDCARIVELRVYRSLAQPQTKLELVDRLMIPGIEELMAIAPLTHSKVTSAGSSRKLPLTRVAVMDRSPDATPNTAVWLCLSGEWQRGSTQTLYGQIVRYDRQRDRLQSMLNWTSPAAELPRWQQITGSATPELVINQSIGLEPQFQVYQVRSPDRPGKLVQLEAIGLTELVLEDATYEHGLLLARNGLWSAALQALQRVKAVQISAVQTSAVQTSRWSTRSQAQLDLIALHAQQTGQQADRTWASPTQQITALLMDGRWAQAFDRLKAAHADGYDIKSLLVANADLFGQRIAASLRVDSTQLEVQRWGVLIQAAQHDRTTAIAWLEQRLKQTQPRLSAQQTQQIFALLDLPTDAPTILDATVALGLLGSATPIDRFNPADWFSPSPLSARPSQAATWYEVQVLKLKAAQPGQRSQSQAKTLWSQLRLSANPPLQLVVWSDTGESQAIAATVQAIRVNQDNLRLLVKTASGRSGRSALAITPDLHWLAPANTLTLAALNQQRPQQTAALIKTLASKLDQTGQMLPVSTAAPDFTSWSVDLLPLTGNAQPEIVLTLQTEQPGATYPRTLIFSSEGALLYSDLQAPGQSIAAIVDLRNGLEQGEPPALILRSPQGYQIRQWSGQAFQ
jgi:hypothetical protein